MFPKSWRNTLISIFVVVWIFVFHYESIRFFYLNPLVGHELPKVKFLFPPAGWIMFYNVGSQTGFAEVFGVKNGKPQFIDPHLILSTRHIFYDNIHRNVLSSVLDPAMAKPFCDHLRRKFSYFEKFLVTYVHYPSLTTFPLERQQKVIYTCP